MPDFNWRWKTAAIVFVAYMAVARYHDFKVSLGLATEQCR